MKRHKDWISVRLLFLALMALALGASQVQAQPTAKKEKKVTYRGGKLTTQEQKAAAERAAEIGLLPGAAALESAAAPEGIEGPGGVPHYFGPYGNWAFSPLPKGSIGSIAVDNGGSGYTGPTVEILDVYKTGTGASATAVLNGGVIESITVDAAGTGYTAPMVVITDPTGTGAEATPILADLSGGIRKFVNRLPGLGSGAANDLGQFIPVGVPETTDRFSGQMADYYEIALVEYEEQLHSDLPPTRLRGYVQIVPQGWSGTDVLGNSYSAVPLTTENGLTENIQIGGAQAYGATRPHYLGPTIVARGRVHGIQKDPDVAVAEQGTPVPVRIKFYNLLPTGEGGDLFLPVDETVMGAGYGPAGPGGAYDMYTQNRATVHLHGNNTIWLSDGNVHQWITPAGENTPYPAGVSARNVPDMDGCSSDPNEPLLPGGSGCMTLYYTNAQSARLQFYHDHAHGITRLNVYSGQAAGYLLTDAVEQDMIHGTNVTGVNPDGLEVLPGLGIPLVIQDKTFVDAETIYAQDPTWNWGVTPGAARTGDLWYPHVYMTVQNPWDLTGTNAFGKWHYGPWFNPPTPECTEGSPVGCIEVGPVPNPYYQPICDGLPDAVNAECTAPWEPPMMPGVPNPSMPGESFFDTMLVNGTPYPFLEVEPKAYRFRVLNASNDRFVNLQLYVAADKNTPTTANESGSATVLCDGAVTDPSLCTEVKMVPVSVLPDNQDGALESGVPDPETAGPEWWMIGTEGGFMPKPVRVPQQPVGWNLDKGYFSYGIVNQHSLYIGAAERADVVVDFSAYAGKTLILYNDAPAPVPAGAAPFDNYTGNGNQMDSGAAPNTLPGYGPNTRTVMQIRVAAAAAVPTPDVTFENLEAVFAKTDSKRGVFEVSQDPIIIPQEAYNSAYNQSFPASAAEQYIQIAETSKTFNPIDEQGGIQSPVTLPLEMKAMHDEMGGVYDTMFGRMSGMLGLSILNSPIHVLIPYGLASPPTDIVMGSMEAKPIGIMPDGTQIWRIFHNGVDTHPVHTHLFHAQLINRVDQSGQVTAGTEPVDPTELGWKDTFKINPLEVTYIAMRPTIPMQDQLPFEVPDSIRLIDPSMPEGATLIPPPPAGWFDPAGNPIPEIRNHYVNFGWEYVWHCHILSHEEMDMMHSLVFVVPPSPPTDLAANVTGNGNNRRVNLSWTDNSTREARFTVQRATNADFSTGLATFDVVNPSPEIGSVVTFQDRRPPNNTLYWYRVFAIGETIGDTQVYPTSPIGFPTMSANSVSDAIMVPVGNAPTAPSVPAAPSNLSASVSGLQVDLTWTDNSNNETGFVIERCMVVAPANTCGDYAQIALAGAGTTSYSDNTVLGGRRYSYRVKAVNGAGSSAYATLDWPVTVAALAAPANVTVSVAPQGNHYRATLSWEYAGSATGFEIQRASNSTFTSDLATFNDSASPLTQNVNRNSVYYYRIRAITPTGTSAWTNAQPFPIRTGPNF
ncbi:MAG: multicopper oxidase domain-containing protein [Acidobacteria bacterium]|nr:multicopper oxidase domain-containing protein [Acidobacteriota bacterium]